MYVQSVIAPPLCGGWHRRGGNVAWPGIVWGALRACPRRASSRTPVLPGLATCLGRGRGAVGHGACPRRDGDLRASRSRTLTRARRRGPARLAWPNEQGIIVRLRDMPLRPPAPLASWLIVATTSLGAGLSSGREGASEPLLVHAAAGFCGAYPVSRVFIANQGGARRAHALTTALGRGCLACHRAGRAPVVNEAGF